MFMVDCTFPTPERWGGERKGGRGSNASHHCPHPCYMCPKTEERQGEQSLLTESCPLAVWGRRAPRKLRL